MGTYNFTRGFKATKSQEYVLDEYSEDQDVIEFMINLDGFKFMELRDAYGLRVDSSVYAMYDMEGRLVGFSAYEYGYYENAMVYYMTLDDFRENSSDGDLFEALQTEADDDGSIIKEVTGLDIDWFDYASLTPFNTVDNAMELVEQYENDVIDDVEF
jgi:hypothetical protein